MANDNDFALGYAMGQDSGGNSGGGFGFGNDGWGGLLGLIVVAGLFGWGGGFGGFGGGMGGAGGAGFQGMATRADINEAFALNGINNGITGLANGLCDGFHNQTIGMMQGFNGVQQGFTVLGQQLSDCCCQTQNAIQGLRYDASTLACDTRNLIQNTTRDLIDNQNANYRSMMDFLVQEKLNAKDAFIAQLQQENALNNLYARVDAKIESVGAEIIRRTGFDYPVASYLVNPPTPVQLQNRQNCQQCSY